MTNANRLLAALAATTTVLAASAASAHPVLKAASPAPDAATGSPSEIRLTFSETLVPTFSSIALKDSAGKAVALGKAQAGADKHVLTAALKGKLVPGAYTVEWRAVGSDTHRVGGRFSFSVN